MGGSRRGCLGGTKQSRKSSEPLIFCLVGINHLTDLLALRLFHGNFVLDSAVPSKLLSMSPNRTEREFTHMRYSAATCDPNEEGWKKVVVCIVSDGRAKINARTLNVIATVGAYQDCNGQLTAFCKICPTEVHAFIMIDCSDSFT
jgi:hypothetical protein